MAADTEPRRRMILPSQPVWVKFSDVGRDDLNWALGMISETTKLPTTPIEEPDFERLSQDFVGSRGFASLNIRGHITALELIREIGPKGVLFARVKIRGYLPRMPKHTSAETTERVQELIDSHFIERKVTVPFRAIVRRSY